MCWQRGSSRSGKILQGVRKFHPSGVECRYTRHMEKPRKRSPTELPMLFEIDPKPLGEELTALGGFELRLTTSGGGNYND
jgi:hypothetical protein